jgi:hypothetical protein
VREAAEADDDVSVDRRPFQVVGDAVLGDQGQAEVLVSDVLGMLEGRVAEGAQGRVDLAVEPALKNFILLPFEHSERIEDQNRYMALIAGDAELEKWGKLHRDIIVRFGRFPHRNAALGRQTTPEEQAFLDEGGFGG